MSEEIIDGNNPEEPQNIGQMINEVAELRNHLNAERKKFKELESSLKSDMEILEVKLLEEQRRLGLTSLSNENFTAFQTSQEKVRVGNWDNFIHYVIESHNYQMLEKRCGKLACLEVKNEGVELSEIGLEYSKEIVVQVRKK
jgi:hypothetical protein